MSLTGRVVRLYSQFGTKRPLLQAMPVTLRGGAAAGQTPEPPMRAAPGRAAISAGAPSCASRHCGYNPRISEWQWTDPPPRPGASPPPTSPSAWPALDLAASPAAVKTIRPRFCAAAGALCLDPPGRCRPPKTGRARREREHPPPPGTAVQKLDGAVPYQAAREHQAAAATIRRARRRALARQRLGHRGRGPRQRGRFGSPAATHPRQVRAGPGQLPAQHRGGDHTPPIAARTRSLALPEPETGPSHNQCSLLPRRGHPVWWAATARSRAGTAERAASHPPRRRA